MANEINIPPRLRNLLQRDHSISGATSTALHHLTSWLSLSQLPFFPDFTDHGTTHISEVLEACEQLVRPVNWDSGVLTAEDAAALSIAVALHDLAMHLTPDGFRFLLRCNWKTPGFSSWQAAWSHFVHEVSRWSTADIERTLGTRVLPKIPSVTDDHSEWTENQRRLIGEFIRRHHAALAELIALYGMPGAMEPLPLPKELPRTFYELTGLLAKSHGMSLRLAVGELSRRFGDVVAPGRIHVPFLMGVLRVSDALQIHANRAPSLRLRVQALRSPLSVAEWAKHAAIIYTSVERPDPEEIYVFCRPESVSTYIGVRTLLADLQKELDSSWAIFGEVYGRHAESGLDKLGLSVRRVRSNLDDPDFNSALSFIPQPAKLSAASGKVLALLSGPLYGDNPIFAIRELLQNAVDAVSARLARSDSQQLHESAKALVVVELSQNCGKKKTLRVTDAGIGMTEEVICNFLLRGGATLSALPPTQNSGLPRIARFGIGALSYFILADEFEVRTRHADAPLDRGICLRPNLREPFIEMHHCSAEIGTTILFRLSDEVYGRLAGALKEWDWWCLRFPIIIRLVEGTELPQSLRAPGPEDEKWEDWNRLQSETGYRGIFWSYTGNPTLVVNGIRVGRGFGGTWVVGGEISAQKLENSVDSMAGLWPIELAMPSVSIFDGERQVELNLARTEAVRASIPLHLICADVLEVIARTFRVHAPKLSELRMERVFQEPHPALGALRRHNYGRLAPWIVAVTGSTLFDVEALPSLGVHRLFILAGSMASLVEASSHIKAILERVEQAAAIFLELDSIDWFTSWVARLAPVDAGPTRIAAARYVSALDFIQVDLKDELWPTDGEQIRKELSGAQRFFLDVSAAKHLLKRALCGRTDLFLAELIIEPTGQPRSRSVPAWIEMTSEFVRPN